jgi:hypothetical protein
MRSKSRQSRATTATANQKTEQQRAWPVRAIEVFHRLDDAGSGDDVGIFDRKLTLVPLHSVPDTLIDNSYA